jgi:hypothetical protein
MKMSPEASEELELGGIAHGLPTRERPRGQLQPDGLEHRATRSTEACGVRPRSTRPTVTPDTPAA